MKYDVFYKLTIASLSAVYCQYRENHFCNKVEIDTRHLRSVYIYKKFATKALLPIKNMVHPLLTVCIKNKNLKEEIPTWWLYRKVHL